MTTREKVQELRKLLEEAVYACAADKSITALQLSGGLDSAIVQAIGGFDHLYCCTWPDFDNLVAAEKAARGKPVKPITFSRSEMIEIALPEVARITEGQGTWSQCCQWFMAREMARDGMLVELNGEGADELFGGYARYRILYWLDRMMEDRHLEEYQGYVHHVLGADREGLVKRLMERSAPKEPLDGVRHALSCGAAMSDAIGLVDYRVGLMALLRHEDAIAASHNLEHRHPFMNEDVIAFAAELTEDDKITAYESKRILREVARDLGVHQDITEEKTKRGLVVPPQWAPAGAAKWSRDWFDKLMAEAWAKVQKAA